VAALARGARYYAIQGRSAGRFWGLAEMPSAIECRQLFDSLGIPLELRLPVPLCVPLDGSVIPKNQPRKLANKSAHPHNGVVVVTREIMNRNSEADPLLCILGIFLNHGAICAIFGAFCAIRFSYSKHELADRANGN
jgi:hypothetical protein